MLIAPLALTSHARTLENPDRRWVVCIYCCDDARIAPLRQSIVEQGDGNLGAVALTPDGWDKEKAEFRFTAHHKPAVTDV